MGAVCGAPQRQRNARDLRHDADNPNGFAGVPWSFALDQRNENLIANAQTLIDLTAARAEEIDPAARLVKLRDMQIETNQQNSMAFSPWGLKGRGI